jgi:hypothetical protein
LAADRQALPPAVEASNPSRSRRRAQKAHEEPQDRCFSGTVWPQQAIDLARLDLDIQASKRRNAAILLTQLTGLNHVHNANTAAEVAWRVALGAAQK